MDFEVRKMRICDRNEILSMMKELYLSEAVSTNGSDEIFETDFKNCISKFQFLEGYVFCREENILGYSMLAKSFSTEFGKVCIWFEDLYLKPEYRGLGIIPKFINHIKTLYTDTIFKLEVEKENTHALHVYKKSGFTQSPYIEMKMD